MSKMKDFTDLFEELQLREIYFRIETDEGGFYFSVIDRKIYPRIWADNFNDNSTIIAESADNLLNRTTIGEKDWTHRFQDESFHSLITQVINWNNKTKLKQP